MADGYQIRPLEIADRKPDLLVGSPDLQRLFRGIADYLSLWCTLYGLREDAIRYSKAAWRTSDLLVFRIYDRRGEPISPYRWDPRLGGDNRRGAEVFLARAERIRRFVAFSGSFRKLLCSIDREFMAYCVTLQKLPSEIEQANRWTKDGFVTIKFVWKDTEPTQRRYDVHRKYDESRPS